MNEYTRANRVINLYQAIERADEFITLELLVNERLEVLKNQGVVLGGSQQKRDENAGAYNELSNFLTRFKNQYDDARALLKDKDDNPPEDSVPN